MKFAYWVVMGLVVATAIASTVQAQVKRKMASATCWAFAHQEKAGKWVKDSNTIMTFTTKPGYSQDDCTKGLLAKIKAEGLVVDKKGVQIGTYFKKGSNHR